MEETITEEKSSSSSMSLDSSLLSDLVSKLQLSPPCPTATKEQTLLKPDWSLLPEELLQLISTHLEKKCCFVDSIHARSVCSSWRSAFAFPCCLLRQSYSVPAYPRKSRDFWTLEKIPLFLYRVKAQTLPSEYFLGEIARDDLRHTEELLQSPLQCSVKVNLPGSDPTVMNLLDCQILPLGHRYRIVGKEPDDLSKLVRYTDVAFLPLNKEGREGGGGGFVVVLNYYRFLLVLRSSNMRWVRFKRLSSFSCLYLFTFKGLFFANFVKGETFVIHPHSLEAIPFIRPLQEEHRWSKYLVQSGDEELFLVDKTIPVIGDVMYFTRAACRVSKLHQKCKWTVVSDLGDRVLFIGKFGNVACSSKELPDGCCLSGNSILFTDWPMEVTKVHKYGVETGSPEDDLGLWRFSSEYHVLLRNRCPPAVAFQIERGEP